MKATLTSPHFWLAILLWSLFLAGTGYWSGIEAAREDAMLEEQARTVQAIQQVIDADAKTLANEKALREQDRKRFTAYRQETSNDLAEKDRYIAGLRNGANRLRVPVRSVCGATPDATGPAATGTGAEGYAELSANGSEFLVEQLARGDTGIRKHAAVVDLYENLRQKCSAPISPTQQEQTP